jgi:hypothetical protein
MIIELLRWWYGPGWLSQMSRIRTRTVNVAHAFSTIALLKTLFAPWRRIVTSGGKSIDAKMQAAIDNFVSRVVGFVSRFFVLIAALIMVSGTFVMSVFIVLVWPLLPLGVIGFIVRGLV